MSTPRRSLSRLAGGLTLALLLAGCGSPDGGADAGTGPAPATPAPSSAPPTPDDRGGSTPAGDRSVPGPRADVAPTTPSVPSSRRPRRVTIPSIGVDAEVITLGIRDDGAIEVPSDARRAGWVTSTPAPGQQGPAVIAGHVDSTTGPAVFYDLRTLRPGDAVSVTLRDGSSVDMTVDGVESYPQDDFPTATVYGPVPGPALRLINCGGAFVRSEGGYQDNVVVYAS